MRIELLVTMIVLGALLSSACPTRRNPLLADADSVADADEDVDADSDPDVGADADADHEPVTCPDPAQVDCDGTCVSLDGVSHCGSCDIRCDTAINGCNCMEREHSGIYACLYTKGGDLTDCGLHQ